MVNTIGYPHWPPISCGLVIWEEPFLNSRADRLAELAARYAMPAIHGVRDFAVAGGLMSYSVVAEEMYHQVGVYAGRILKGDKPGDLPVLQPTKIELVINLKMTPTHPLPSLALQGCPPSPLPSDSVGLRLPRAAEKLMNSRVACALRAPFGGGRNIGK
jgi:hypothetical protein